MKTRQKLEDKVRTGETRPRCFHWCLGSTWLNIEVVLRSIEGKLQTRKLKLERSFKEKFTLIYTEINRRNPGLKMAWKRGNVRAGQKTKVKEKTASQ